MINNSPTKILDWAEVKPIFNHYLSVWSNHIPLNWACSAWQKLHKSGFTVFNNEDEEMKARAYAVALCLIYYEYCHRTAFNESENFRFWDESIIKEVKSEFLRDLEKDDELIFHVKNCLFKHFGELELCSELWINCAESRQEFVFSIKEKAKLQDELINVFANDFNFEQGKHFILGAEIDEITNYQSISGL